MNNIEHIPCLMQEATKDTDVLSAIYDRISASQLALGRVLVERMCIGRKDTVVDVGCGTGRLALEIADRPGFDGKVIGLDPSPQRIRTAEEKLKSGRHGNIEFVVGDAENLSMLALETADDIYYSSVFHWIKDKEKALAEAFRVLRPGGRIGMTTIASDGPFTFTEVMSGVMSRPEFRRFISTQGRSRKVTASALNEMLLASGFVNVQVGVTVRRTFHRSAENVIRFFEASSFGNFLRDVPSDVRKDVVREIAAELEMRRGPEGIEMLSNSVLALAQRP